MSVSILFVFFLPRIDVVDVFKITSLVMRIKNFVSMLFLVTLIWFWFWFWLVGWSGLA